MESSFKSGSRRGRANYPIEFKRALALAACAPDISVARLALEHGVNANMLHKWRRQHLAGELGLAKARAVEFLPVTLSDARYDMRNRSDQTTLAPPKPASIEGGVIEIRSGHAVVRIEGAVDAGVLGAVLRHFHP